MLQELRGVLLPASRPWGRSRVWASEPRPDHPRRAPLHPPRRSAHRLDENSGCPLPTTRFRRAGITHLPSSSGVASGSPSTGAGAYVTPSHMARPSLARFKASESAHVPAGADP